MGIDMKYEEFISEYTRVIMYKYLKHADEVLHYDDEEDKYVGMVLIIRHGDEATDKFYTVKWRRVVEYG